MDAGPDDEAEPAFPPAPASAVLDLEAAAEALDEDPEVVAEAFAEADVDPETVADALAGAEADATVGPLAEALDRSEASVAVALADALEIREDELTDLVHRLDADPGEVAEAIRDAHLDDLLEGIGVAGWFSEESGDEPPTLDEVVEAARKAERRVLAGGLFLAATLVALGLVMFNAPPALRQVIWVVLGLLLVASGLGLVLLLVQVSDLSNRYLDRAESLADEFEGDSVTVVSEIAQQASLGRRAREEAMRRSWRLFQQARADDGDEAEGDEGPDAGSPDDPSPAGDGDGPEPG